MAAAAKAANCVPSNVVTRVKELESELGQDLFSRDKGRVLATPFGRIFYREAKALLKKAAKLNNFAGEHKDRGLLRVGALDVVMLEYLPARIPAYLKANPGIELTLLRRASFTLERMLTDKEIDVALTDGPIQHPLLRSLPAYDEDLYLVASAAYGSARAALEGAGKSVTAFLFNDDCFYRPHFDAWLQKQGLASTPIVTIESYEVIAECVRAGLGISCFPASIAKRYDAEEMGLRLFKLDDLAPGAVYFVWRRAAENSVLHTFVQHLSRQ